MPKKHVYVPEVVCDQSKTKEKPKRAYAAMKLSSAGKTNENPDTSETETSETDTVDTETSEKDTSDTETSETDTESDLKLQKGTVPIIKKAKISRVKVESPESAVKLGLRVAQQAENVFDVSDDVHKSIGMAYFALDKDQKGVRNRVEFDKVKFKPVTITSVTIPLTPLGPVGYGIPIHISGKEVDTTNEVVQGPVQHAHCVRHSLQATCALVMDISSAQEIVLRGLGIELTKTVIPTTDGYASGLRLVKTGDFDIKVNSEDMLKFLKAIFPNPNPNP